MKRASSNTSFCISPHCIDACAHALVGLVAHEAHVTRAVALPESKTLKGYARSTFSKISPANYHPHGSLPPSICDFKASVRLADVEKFLGRPLPSPGGDKNIYAGSKLLFKFTWPSAANAVDASFDNCEGFVLKPGKPSSAFMVAYNASGSPSHLSVEVVTGTLHIDQTTQSFCTEKLPAQDESRNYRVVMWYLDEGATEEHVVKQADEIKDLKWHSKAHVEEAKVPNVSFKDTRSLSDFVGVVLGTTLYHIALAIHECMFDMDSKGGRVKAITYMVARKRRAATSPVSFDFTHSPFGLAVLSKGEGAEETMIMAGKFGPDAWAKKNEKKVKASD